MNLSEFENKFYKNNHPLIMGILNVTPDSFSDGGRYFDFNSAIEHAERMQREGADIIDVGGESTRPGAEKISEDEELSRVIPVIEKICSKINVAVSVDTYKSRVAEYAIEAGAVMVNDISAFCFDPLMPEVLVKSGCFSVLMHMLGNPETMQKNPVYRDVVKEVADFLKIRLNFALMSGISLNKLILDPGIGFGKTLENNLELIRNINKFSDFGCPLLIGTSRKSFLGKITGAPVNDRDWGTAAVTAWCVSKGVRIHRVHEVKGMRQVCDVAYAIGEKHGY
jgi:dihydropteroate synthase